MRGDMAKLRYVPGLSRAPKCLLLNIQHTARKIPGTHATRRPMRFDTHANRVRYGVPIFVAFSPDGAHNLLMVRLSRVRRNDPVLRGGKDVLGSRYCGRGAPDVACDLADGVVLGIPVHELMQGAPPMRSGAFSWREILWPRWMAFEYW